jgi:hypothetical protein
MSRRAEEAVHYQLLAEDLVAIVTEKSARTVDPEQRKELEADMDVALEPGFPG